MFVCIRYIDSVMMMMMMMMMVVVVVSAVAAAVAVSDVIEVNNAVQMSQVADCPVCCHHNPTSQVR